MKLKTYYSGSVEAAMELAREELGPEAMIVYSRKSDPGNRQLGEYEVVFATDEPSAAAPPAEPAGPAMPPASLAVEIPAPWTSMSAEIGDLRRQLERLTGIVSRTAMPATTAPPEFARIAALLIEEGFDAELVQDLTRDAASLTSLVGAGADPVHAAMEAAFTRRLRPAPPVIENDDQRKVAAFVGPAGGGKTSVLAKFAAAYGLAARRPAFIVSADTLRVAATEQLRTYASILGIGFAVAETPRALSQILEELRGKSLVLIDTPGYSPSEMDEAELLSRCFACIPNLEVHLVLTATSKTSDLTRAMDRFGIFTPNQLVLTRIDETTSYGSALSAAMRSGIPVGHLSAGPGVPEDLRPVTVFDLAGLALPPKAGGAAAAA
ncbi:MAG TPA: hypothetical protein DEH78_11490 [Solibacterales bacterium]|nr:hypothetical protein [Bryobacterales bacterium]